MPKPIRRIGVSKFATVSECQTPQGTHFALKEYNRQPLSKIQHELIFTAAQRWTTLNIPGLVPYLEVAPERNEVVMERFDRSAAIRLSEGYSDPRLVLHALRGILAALAQLHEQGWLHANLKPTNVFFDGDGRARLSDGLLMSVSAPVTLPPPSNQKYLTPEHTSDEFGPMTPATDLYAVGFMALELLAGDHFGRAFQGIRDDAPDDDVVWFQWHASSQEAPSANSFSKTCPAELSAVIARLVAKQPSERYRSARQAFDDLPQDITVQSRLPTQTVATQAVATQAKREVLSAHVVERPATGIVLAIASGSRAGEMIGTNDNELMIGFDHDCFLRFSSEQYPHRTGKVLLRRSSEGWYVLRVAGDSAFVNQHLLEDKSPLRSGDIVRLSSRGPDVQFTMQSGGVAVRALVDRFLPSQPHAPRGPAATLGAAAGPANRPLPGGAPSHAPGAAQLPQQRMPQMQSPAHSAVGQPVAAAPLTATHRAQATPQQGDTTAVSAFSWIARKAWSRNMTNTIIAAVAGILVLLAV
ncbi:MAG: hypothetical protein KDA51_17695, partial [Planctomycetales bacterium]|nr:hypothetical protein [Planctomycetales bacterium]